jgi:tetratricopeptide (TPR) repeat protein
MSQTLERPPPPGGDNERARAEALLGEGRPGAALDLLRAAPLAATDRPAAVAASLAAAGRDPDFQAAVRDADAARDEGDFARGEFLYWRCLQLYPLHHGYLTQYGHCLKEQGKFAEAEAVYRSALALGAPADDLGRHIAAAAAAREADPALPAAAPDAAAPADLPPTLDEVALLLALLLQRGPASAEETLDLLRDCPTRADVALALVARPDFPRANADLLALLAETGR